MYIQRIYYTQIYWSSELMFKSKIKYQLLKKCPEIKIDKYKYNFAQNYFNEILLILAK